MRLVNHRPLYFIFALLVTVFASGTSVLAGSDTPVETKIYTGWFSDVAINGWAKLTGHNVIDLARKFEEYGAESIIYTDIGRDGMLGGVNIDATVRLSESLSVPVVASGGVSNLKDIENLCEVSNIGIRGVITGRAIYEGSLDFKAAQELADQLTGS